MFTVVDFTIFSAGSQEVSSPIFAHFPICPESGLSGETKVGAPPLVEGEENVRRDWTFVTKPIE